MVAARGELWFRIPAWVCLGACLAAGGARAQPPERAVEFEDLGLTRPGEVSARGAGLSAFVPAANDVTALIYNPAGLCRVKQRSAWLALSHDAREIVTGYGSNSSGLSSNRNGVLFAGGTFPIPVLRGSLVPAVAVHRMFVSDLDISYHRYDTALARADDFRIQQSGASYAFALGFGVDLASVLSAGVSCSAFEGGYRALRQSHTRTDTGGGALDRYVVEDIDGDLDGIVGRVGVILYAHRHLHIAVNVTTPTLVNHNSAQTNEITEIVENSTGSSATTVASTAAEYLVPYRLDGGIAIPWGNWLVALEAGTCDWTQAAVDQSILRLQDGSSAFSRTIDASAGVEWTAPWWPLRLRGSVARLPFALDYLQADRIDNDQLEEVLTQTPPLRFSIGAGVALKHTIVIDASFSRTQGDRRSASMSEERTWSQLALEGSYWF
jgi:hypothetical protein